MVRTNKMIVFLEEGISLLPRAREPNERPHASCSKTWPLQP